jgi:hypothetical protein
MSKGLSMPRSQKKRFQSGVLTLAVVAALAAPLFAVTP